MAASSAKRARLQEFRDKLPYISQTALATVLKVAADDGVPEVASRRSFARARDHFSKASTPYGPLHHLLDVGGEGFEVQNPFAMLYHVAKNSPVVASALQAAASQQMCTVADPFHLLLYADEITPGNQLAYKTERKFWGFYWTIAEFGTARLSDEAQF